MTDRLSLGRRKFLKTTGAASLVGTVGIAGCLGDDELSFTMTTSSTGTSTHAAGTALQRAVDEESDTLSMTIQQSDCWVANAYLYNDDESTALGTDMNTAAQAHEGRGPFEDEPVSKLPAQGFHFTALHIYLVGVEGTGLESSDDIGDEDTVYPIQPGFGTRLLTEEVFERGSIEQQAGDYINVDVGDIAGAIEEGRVDALAVYGSDFVALAGWVEEVDARNDVYLLEAGDDLIQGIEETPGARYVQFEPYGWDQDVTEVTNEVHSWTLDGQWWFGPDVDPDTVYEVCRVSSEHGDVIQEADPTYPDHSDPEDMLAAIDPTFPVHEGAAEFFQDHGVWDDSLDIANEHEI